MEAWVRIWVVVHREVVVDRHGVGVLLVGEVVHPEGVDLLSGVDRQAVAEEDHPVVGVAVEAGASFHIYHPAVDPAAASAPARNAKSNCSASRWAKIPQFQPGSDLAGPLPSLSREPVASPQTFSIAATSHQTGYTTLEAENQEMIIYEYQPQTDV